VGQGPEISIVLSFRNEEAVIPELVRRLTGTLEGIPAKFELIFVNDASSDGSLKLLEEYRGTDPRVKIVTMSRVYGVAEGILAGIARASGDAVVYMDSDLQDPPEVIPEMVARWREGADVVYTVRTRRQGENPLRRAATKVAYKIIRGFTTEIDLTVEAGDFKLLSRRVADKLLELRESDPYIRGLVPWLGFRQVPVYYERQPRLAGRSHFPVFRNFFRDMLTFRGGVGTFIAGVTSFSILPLALFFLAGAAILALSILAGILLVILGCFGRAPSSPAVIVTAAAFFSGIQLLGLGTVGFYLARVYRDVRGRPRYVVREERGFEDPPSGGGGSGSGRGAG